MNRFASRRTRYRLLPLAYSIAALLFGLAMIAAGRFKSFQGCGWVEIAALGALWVALLASATRRVRGALAGRTASLVDDIEIGALLLATAEAVALLGGGVQSPLYPVVYLVMAFLVAFLRPRAGVLLTGCALVFDLLAFLGLKALPNAWPEYAAHAGFLTLFAVLYQGVLAAQVAASRRAEGAAVARRLRQFEERAREYRLIASGTEHSDAGPEAQARWVAAAVKEVEQAVGAALEVAECALHTHTCAVFLLSPDDRDLRLQDCRSLSDTLVRDPFNAGEGILGGVVKRRMPLRLCGDFKGVSYYQREMGIRSLLAVPLIDRRAPKTTPELVGLPVDPPGFVRGVLLADRLEAIPFEDEDERLLQAVGREVLRAIEIERVMGYIKSARDEKDRFYRAIEELNRAAKPDEVFETALDICRSLAPIDFGAITLCEEQVDDGETERFHRIVRVSGVHGGQALQGHRFKDNNGLCANVVRYGTPLPGRGVRLGERPLVFGEEAELRGIQALKILPLKSGDRVLGTLVAASRRRGAFDDDVVRMLEVIALQAAQSLQRAQLFAEVERMAVTDGLTGLHNHRHFQNLLDQRLALARRYGKPTSLLIADIDHFKTVNDTYGHPVGDAVLRGVAKLLSTQARAVDLVARYGGEEFALILPETDSAAAGALAERIRAAVAATELRTSLGPVKVTLSLGVATFPDVAEDKQGLIDRADQALYAAKHAGRNRFTVAEAKRRLAGA